MPAYQVLRWTVLPGGPCNPLASLDVVEQAALRSGRILAAIDACQPWVRAWRYLAYGAVPSRAHRDIVLAHLPDPSGTRRGCRCVSSCATKWRTRLDEEARGRPPAALRKR
jgi:hypothetical protein